MFAAGTRITRRLASGIPAPNAPFEVALLRQALVLGNPTRRRDTSQNRFFLAHASGFQKNATSKDAPDAPDAPEATRILLHGALR